MKRVFFVFVLISCGFIVKAEDGSKLWLRYDEVGAAKVNQPYNSPTLDIAADELRKYYRGREISFKVVPDATWKYIVSQEGFVIQDDTIYATSDIGILYGAYSLLRKQATTPKGSKITAHESPRVRLRILNHWDNLDGSIERGYAGKSIFWVPESKSLSPQTTDFGSKEWKARIIEYCRANASIGINGSVLNNVNASPKILSAEYIKKVRTIADIFRPYGIRVYLSINFASPMVLGGLKTADPLDKNVRKWWVRKVKEIYAQIPDFGGFLVKANSEGQPGPGDYHRSHADGANMLADALKPFGGIVMWRSFVYGANHKGEDRVKQAVSEFKDLDGMFRENVILQSKNGPLDFQPREPYAPIFDNIHKTSQMAELQITQEYLGQSRHLVYLAPMWKEFFSFLKKEADSFSSDSIPMLKGVAGVANVGDDVNWCGHHFSQANWYAFGRLAWDSGLSSEDIAHEWLLQTFCDNWHFVSNMTHVMETSRETCVNYMMPLGLHHIFKFDHHYGPEPDGFRADYPIEWCPVYYHKADSIGVGFDRTEKTGTGAVSQYRHPYDSIYNDIKTCPEEYLLWFHHVPWNYKMKNGKTLWQNLHDHYILGCLTVGDYVKVWQQMRPYVDEQRWGEVDERLRMQYENAEEWSNACLYYFETFVDENGKFGKITSINKERKE